MGRSVQVRMVFRRSSRARGRLLALSRPNARRKTGRHGEAGRGRKTERELRADVGTVLLLPKEVFHRERRSAIQAGSAKALRSGGFRLSLESCGAFGLARLNRTRLSGDGAYRRLAYVGSSNSSLG